MMVTDGQQWQCDGLEIYRQFKPTKKTKVVVLKSEKGFDRVTTIGKLDVAVQKKICSSGSESRAPGVAAEVGQA